MTQARNKISLYLVALYACLASSAVQSATIGELFVISNDPLFAEIPVCNPGPKGIGFTAKVVTDEALDSDGRQPFAEKIQAAFDTYSNIEGLISVSAEDPAPSGVSIIVTLVNSNGNNEDSSLFNNLSVIKKAPDDFGCVALVEETTVVAESASAGDFIVDIVTGDTWRNIADLVNVAWYGRSYSIEQVMLALYQYNNAESLNLQPGRIYSLPNQLLVPDSSYPATIDRNQLSKASYLDETGRLKVVKKKNSGLEKLRQEFALLKEQVALLKKQLDDSYELIQLKSSEIDTLKTNLIKTRQRISLLETENQTLNDRNIVSFIGESFHQNAIFWIAMILLLLILIAWLLVRGNNMRQQQNIALIRKHRDEKKKVTVDEQGKESPFDYEQTAGSTQAPAVTNKKEFTESTVDFVPIMTGKAANQSDENQQVKFPNALPIVDEYTKDSDSLATGSNHPLDHESKANDQNNDEAQSLFDLANAYISMGDKKEAKETLMQAIRLGTEPVKSKSLRLLKNFD